MPTIDSDLLTGYEVTITRRSMGIEIGVKGDANDIVEVYEYFCELYGEGGGYVKKETPKEASKKLTREKIRQFKAIEAKRKR